MICDSTDLRQHNIICDQTVPQKLKKSKKKKKKSKKHKKIKKNIKKFKIS